MFTRCVEWPTVVISVAVLVSLVDGQCYDDLGCLETNSTWYGFFRPINFLAQSRSAIDTRFALYTREQRTIPTFLDSGDTSTIAASNFRGTRRTKMYIHGWNSWGNKTIVSRLIANFLIHDDYNVINVQWGPGANVLYAQAVANTRVVGLEIAKLINVLTSQFSANVSDFHLIGHSLGSHIAGYAGERLNKLGRITGLDPAGPHFEFSPTWVRLDPSDATLVDAIHTDGYHYLGFLGLGLMQPVGHLDFYPNAGRIQPGCAQLDGVTFIECNHKFSKFLLADSLLENDCQPVAYECDSFGDFKHGKCVSCGSDNTACSPFGIDAEQYTNTNRTGVRMFLRTGSAKLESFCVYQYGITVTLANPAGARSRLHGMLLLTIYGADFTVDRQRIVGRGGDTLQHGTDWTWLFHNPSDVGVVSRMTLHWTHWNSIGAFCGPLCSSHLYVSSVQISSLNRYPESNRLANTYTLCPSSASYADLASGTSFDFDTAC